MAQKSQSSEIVRRHIGAFVLIEGIRCLSKQIGFFFADRSRGHQGLRVHNRLSCASALCWRATVWERLASGGGGDAEDI